MVSAQPAPTDSGAARDAEPEATRSRRVLRGDGELLLAEPYEGDRGADLAEVAFSAQLERLLRLGEPVGAAGAVSAAGSTGRPLSVPARVNRWPDEPDALIGHVRICGSPGWVTAQGDPANPGMSPVEKVRRSEHSRSCAYGANNGQQAAEDEARQQGAEPQAGPGGAGQGALGDGGPT